MYHRLHNTSCWLSKTTAIYWSKKPLWRVYGSRSEMQTVQALAWTTNRNSNDSYWYSTEDHSLRITTYVSFKSLEHRNTGKCRRHLFRVTAGFHRRSQPKDNPLRFVQVSWTQKHGKTPSSFILVKAGLDNYYRSKPKEKLYDENVCQQYEWTHCSLEREGMALRGFPCQLLSPSIATNASDHVVMVKFIICYHTTFIMLSYHFFSCCHFTFFMLDTEYWKEYIRSLETNFYKFLSIS